MSQTLVRHLIVKDWHFNRWVIVFYFAVGTLSLAAVAVGEKATFYIGSVLFLSAVIGLGIHLVMESVVLERKEQTLPFIMSLPISTMEYTRAKVVACLSAFLVPWTGLLVGGILILTQRSALPNGLVPFFTIVTLELLVAYVLVLGVALVTESEAWTIGIVVACNVLLNFFLYFTSHLPGIQQYQEGPIAVWNSTALSLIAVEIAAVALILALTFYVQGRKRDFV